MGKKRICMVVASLFAATPAFAQYYDWRWEGSATVGPIWTDKSDTKDPTKLQEYRDLRDGALSNIYGRGRNGQPGK